MTHYRLPLGNVSSGGNPIRQPLPASAPTLSPSCTPPFHVLARLDVDRDGRVVDVVGAAPDGDASVSTAPWQRYFDAVHAATTLSRFQPLQVTHWAAGAAGNSHVADTANERFTRRCDSRFAPASRWSA